jgi:uncharacterized membrane protein
MSTTAVASSFSSGPLAIGLAITALVLLASLVGFLVWLRRKKAKNRFRS